MKTKVALTRAALKTPLVPRRHARFSQLCFFTVRTAAHTHACTKLTHAQTLRPRVRRIPFNYLLARGLRHFVCNYAKSSQSHRQYGEFCRKEWEIHPGRVADSLSRWERRHGILDRGMKRNNGGEI